MLINLKKRNVYLVDLGTGTDRNLLPLGIGFLSSYCKKFPEIREEFNIELRFLRTGTKEMVDSFDDPVLVGISCYMWNFNASMALARLVKQRFPNCIIVGGAYSMPNITSRIEPFVKAHPYIDVMVHGEGEIVLSSLLLNILAEKDFSTIDGITFRQLDSPGGYIQTRQRTEGIELDDIPSPFLNGEFDQFIKQDRDKITGMIWETSRDCPYSCTFCAWGKTDGKSIRKFNLDRLFEELEWVSRNKISYMASSDANFGIFYERDLQIANKISKLHKDTGYPKHLTWSWAKNSNEKVMRIADVFREAGVNARVLISMQSFDKNVGKVIKRRNMASDRFESVKKMYHRRNLPTMTEMILGLPVETFKGWRGGLEAVMSNGLTDRFQVYLCCIIDGSEMAEQDYIEKYSLETRKCINAMERMIPDPLASPEEEEIVVSTSTMPLDDWKKAYILTYTAVALFNFPLIFFVINFLHQRFNRERIEFIEYLIHEVFNSPNFSPRLSLGLNHLKNQQESILLNGDKLTKMPQLGGVASPPGEAAAIIFLEDADSFYGEIREIVLRYCEKNKFSLPAELLDELILYQRIRIPTWPIPNNKTHHFEYNIPDYFHSLVSQDEPVSIKKLPMQLSVKIQENKSRDEVDFARNRIIGSYNLEMYEVEYELLCEEVEVV
jgi:radical SAM superfamily enzyme YgiQ (UPF0313 family)